MDKAKHSFRKFKQRPFYKSKRSFRRRLPPIQPGDRIDYRNISLLSRFISDQGKILSRRRNKVTLKQQRLITIAIKQARILSSLPFRNPVKGLKKMNAVKGVKKMNPVKGANKMNPRKGLKKQVDEESQKES